MNAVSTKAVWLQPEGRLTNYYHTSPGCLDILRDHPDRREGTEEEAKSYGMTPCLDCKRWTTRRP